VRGNHDFHIFGAHLRSEDEKFLYRFIAQARQPMDAALSWMKISEPWFGAPLLPGMKEVEFIGVIYFHR